MRSSNKTLTYVTSYVFLLAPRDNTPNSKDTIYDISGLNIITTF